MDSDKSNGSAGGFEELEDAYVSLEQVSKWLGLDEDQVTRLDMQGRLSSDQIGDEKRYELGSVGRMVAEELIRSMTAKAEEDCSELAENIGELAALQYQRGNLSGAH